MNMRKAAHPSGGMGSSNPRRWRGERLQHHGDVVFMLFVLFVRFLTRDSSVVLIVRRVHLEVLQSEPPRLAP